MKLSKEQFESIINECCKHFSDLFLDATLHVLAQTIYNDPQKDEFTQKYNKFEDFKIKDENNGLFKASLNVSEDGSILFMLDDRNFNRYVLKVNGLQKNLYKNLTKKTNTEYVPVLVFSYYNVEQKATKYYSVFLYNNANCCEDKIDLRLDYVVSVNEKSQDDPNTNDEYKILEKHTSEQVTKKFIKETFIPHKQTLNTTDEETF